MLRRLKQQSEMESSKFPISMESCGISDVTDADELDDENKVQDTTRSSSGNDHNEHLNDKDESCLSTIDDEAPALCRYDSDIKPSDGSAIHREAELNGLQAATVSELDQSDSGRSSPSPDGADEFDTEPMPGISD